MAKKDDNKKGAKLSEEEIAARKAAAASAKAKKDADRAEASAEASKTAGEIPTPRKRTEYSEKVVPAMIQAFGYKNRLAVPKLEKIVISMGVGKYAVAGGEGKAKIDRVEQELTAIAGQKPLRCKAKKAVANFKVREGMETGLKVTLRGTRMFEFLDRMITLAIPRVKDFRGLNPNAFDGDGNFNFGFSEQTVFPEVDAATVTFTQGMNITMVTTAKSVKEGRELLKQFGMPFRSDVKESSK
jgi:large subunit ribosomal protein L5